MKGRTDWSVDVEGDAVVAEFPGGTRLTPADADAAIREFSTRIRTRDVEAVVLVVRTSRPCSDAGRRMLRETAQVAVANEVDRWAVVAQRAKREYLIRTVDVEGLTVEGFNDPDPALRWTRTPRVERNQ